MKIQKNYIVVKKIERKKVKLSGISKSSSISINSFKDVTKPVTPRNSVSLSEIPITEKKTDSDQLKRTRTQSVSSVTLSWDNINVFSKTKAKVNCCKRSNDNISNSDFNIDMVSSNPPSESSNSSSNSPSVAKEYPNQILQNICGIIQPGQCLAIMGASGSGKTTLLNVLNFRTPRVFTVSGNIKINGKKVSADELGSHVGFVPQDDLFIGTLTVFEHLQFLAMLKMSNKYTRSEKVKRVKEVIDEFRLTKCKDILIGYPDKKGISGGEKRRLAFASEILTDPEILFCDEPTSGLDSHMAQMVVNTIFNLAKKGKTIISTIHQPSSQVYEKFDMLCLLAEGRVAYFGERKDAYHFFASIDYICPNQFNPADYFIEILATRSNHIESTQKVKAICDSYEKSDYHKNVLTQISIQTKNENVDKNRDLKKRKSKTFQASYFSQFIYLFWRQFKSTFREPFSTRILFAQSIVIGLFLGFTYFQSKNDQASVQNKNGLLFILLMQSVLSYLFGVANQYHNQWVVTRLEVKNRVYSVFIYYIAKTLSEVPQNIIFPTITATIVYWISYLNSSVTVYLVITSIVVLTANVAVGYGTFLAIIAPNLDGTVGLIGPTVLPLLIFSGFLINNKSIPVYFVWIKYISWIYYANEALMITLWSNINNISCDKPDIQVPSVYGNITTFVSVSQCLKNGTDVLEYFSIDKNNLERDIGILVSMCCFWPIVAGIFLYLKSKLQ